MRGGPRVPGFYRRECAGWAASCPPAGKEEIMTDFTPLRRAMVRRQIAARGIADRRVLDALGTVPREAFVPENLAEFAYEDTPLPIEAEQTISQPYIVALMAEALELGPEDRVLE